MNVNFTPLQSIFNNYNVNQLVLRPIILTIAAIALAIFTIAVVSSCLSRRPRHPQRNPYPTPSTGTARSNPTPQPSPLPSQSLNSNTWANRYDSHTTLRPNLTATATSPNPTTTLRPNPTATTRPNPTTTPFNPFAARDPSATMLPSFANQHSSIHQPRQTVQTPPAPERYSGGTFEIRVKHEDIFIEIPYEKFMELVAAIEKRGLGMDVNVTFIGEPGIDGGGLRRQYFSELFQSLLLNTDRNTGVYTDSGIFKLHETKNKMKLLIPQDDPTDDPTISLFYGIGAAMAYVYFNDQLVIGSIFHQAFYDAILCLSDEEIALPYDQLSDATKIKMCRTLMTIQHELGGEDFRVYFPVLEFLEKGDQFTEADLDLIEAFYANEKMDIEEKTKGSRDEFLSGQILEGEFEPRFNKDAIMKDKQGFIISCMEMILSKNTQSLGKPGQTLCPIHTMAKGLKDAADKANVTVSGRIVKGTRWPEIRSLKEVAGVTGPRRLMYKVQGSLDRQVLIDSIVVAEHDRGNEVVRNQVEWIKTWVRKETTTPLQLEWLLFFWTGSTTLGEGGRLYVQAQGMVDVRVPKAGTCFNRMYVSEGLFGTEGDSLFRNDTEEGFHAMLEEAIQPQQSEQFHRA